MLPHRQVVQAKALVWAADGVANEEIARRSQVDSDTVRRWRNRFADKGVDGVGTIGKGRGRKSWLPADTVQRVVELTLTGRPPGGGDALDDADAGRAGRGRQGHRCQDLVGP